MKTVNLAHLHNLNPTKLRLFIWRLENLNKEIKGSSRSSCCDLCKLARMQLEKVLIGLHFLELYKLFDEKERYLEHKEEISLLLEESHKLFDLIKGKQCKVESRHCELISQLRAVGGRRAKIITEKSLKYGCDNVQIFEFLSYFNAEELLKCLIDGKVGYDVFGSVDVYTESYLLYDERIFADWLEARYKKHLDKLDEMPRLLYELLRYVLSFDIYSPSQFDIEQHDTRIVVYLTQRNKELTMKLLEETAINLSNLDKHKKSKETTREYIKPKLLKRISEFKSFVESFQEKEETISLNKSYHSFYGTPYTIPIFEQKQFNDYMMKQYNRRKDELQREPKLVFGEKFKDYGDVLEYRKEKLKSASVAYS